MCTKDFKDPNWSTDPCCNRSPYKCCAPKDITFNKSIFKQIKSDVYTSCCASDKSEFIKKTLLEIMNNLNPDYTD
jgi:hypothetical protein